MTRHQQTHRRRGRIPSTAAAIALALAVSACNGGSDEPEPLPPETSASTPTDTPTPTQDPDAWRTKFDPAELKAYDAALQRWEEYESRSEPIWAKGEVTPAAEALFKEYWSTWGVLLNRLQTYEKNGISISGTAKVLSSKAASINLSSAKRVVLKQCIDPSPITDLVNGEPPERQRKLDPYVRTITLDRITTTNQFMVSGVLDVTNAKKVKRCDS